MTENPWSDWHMRYHKNMVSICLNAFMRCIPFSATRIGIPVYGGMVSTVNPNAMKADET